MLKYEDFDNVNIICFDLNKYNITAKSLKINILANYRGKTLVSDDIPVFTKYFGYFKNGQWHIKDESGVLKRKGLDWMIDFLYYQKKNDEYYEDYGEFY